MQTPGTTHHHHTCIYTQLHESYIHASILKCKQLTSSRNPSTSRRYYISHSTWGAVILNKQPQKKATKTSHKKVCQTQTSTCRDETLKNQPNKMGTTPQYFYTIPTSCAILPTVHNTKPSTSIIISPPTTKNERSTSLQLSHKITHPSHTLTWHYEFTTAHLTATCIQEKPYLSC